MASVEPIRLIYERSTPSFAAATEICAPKMATWGRLMAEQNSYMPSLNVNHMACGTPLTDEAPKSKAGRDVRGLLPGAEGTGIEVDEL